VYDVRHLFRTIAGDESMTVGHAPEEPAMVNALRAASPTILAVVGVLSLATIAEPLEAQSGRGFLFGAPSGSFTLRGGYAVANAGSGVFEDAISQLTIDKRDFSSLTFGGDIAYSPTRRFDIVFDGEVSSSSHGSEFRAFVDNNDLPIEQETKFRRVPLTVGFRYYLADRGRQVSQFAYIPSRYAPYVGAAAGTMYYRFKQEGDFIDFNTPNSEVFPATIEDSGWTPMAHGMAGVDYTLGPWLALVVEGRYQWAKARLDPDVFEGYDKIDLTGFTGTLGFKVRF
jgi:hypothetical protein